MEKEIIEVLLNKVFSGYDPNDRTSAYHSPSKGSSFCGTDIPTPISSSGNVMTVMMVSDSTVSSRGFKARWDSSQSAGITYITSKRLFPV